MQDDDVGPIAYLVAGFFHSQAQIYFLVIEKETFVEISNTFKGAPPDDGESAGNPIHIGGFVRVRTSPVFRPKNREFGNRADRPEIVKK